MRPFKFLEKGETIQDIFTKMGYDETVNEESFDKIECYFCIFYGKSKLKSVNEAILYIFLKT